MFKNLYTTESGLLTPPELTMTKCGTPAAMHALATLTSPSLSTAAAVPPSFEADAAKMTARDLEIAADMVEGCVTSQTATEQSWSWASDKGSDTPSAPILLLKTPDRLVAITGMDRSRHARTHMVPVLPLAPITQMGAAEDAVAALADDAAVDQTPLAARTAAIEDAAEASKNWRREDSESAALSLSPSALLEDADDKG